MISGTLMKKETMHIWLAWNAKERRKTTMMMTMRARMKISNHRLVMLAKLMMSKCHSTFTDSIFQLTLFSESQSLRFRIDSLTTIPNVCVGQEPHLFLWWRRAIYSFFLYFCHRYDSNAQTTDSESGSEGGEKKEKSKPKKEKSKKPKSEVRFELTMF